MCALAGTGPNRWPRQPARPSPCLAGGSLPSPRPGAEGEPGGVMGVGLRAPPGPALPRACFGKGRVFGRGTRASGTGRCEGIDLETPAGGGVPGAGAGAGAGAAPPDPDLALALRSFTCPGAACSSLHLSLPGL